MLKIQAFEGPTNQSSEQSTREYDVNKNKELVHGLLIANTDGMPMTPYGLKKHLKTPPKSEVPHSALIRIMLMYPP